MAELSLLRSQRASHSDKLNGSRIKSIMSSYDEWRENTDIVSLSPTPEQSTSSSQVPIHQPYSLYKELTFKIKQLLTCG